MRSPRPDGADLQSALLKLYQDNASTLTPDPVFVKFYYCASPASERLGRMTPFTLKAPRHEQPHPPEPPGPERHRNRHAAEQTQRRAGPGLAPDRRLAGKTYSFKNYYETIAFVNALAFIAATPKTTTPTSR